MNRPLAQLTRELDGDGGLLREYQYGQDLVSMKAPTSTHYFHHDGLGSVTNVTSSTGTAMWTYGYNPYGDTRTETKNNNQAPTNFMKFAGQYLDPTSLYHLRARQYDPGTGRFLSVDPLQGQLTNPHMASYAYARNCPSRFADPSGLESQPPAGGPSQPDILKGLSDAFNSRVGPCRVGELGLGIGLIVGGAGLEVAVGLGEIASVGALTPAVAIGIVVGVGDIVAGQVRVRDACAAIDPLAPPR